MKILIAALLVIATPAMADVIAPEDAATNVGQTITVEGKAMVRTDASGITYFDMGGAFPHNSFMAAIFGSSAGLFPNAASYNGKTVDVTGTVQLYEGKGEIILTSPSQLSAK